MTGFRDRLDSASLQATLKGHPFVTTLVYQSRLGSSNDLAKELASEGAAEGLLVITNEQSAGRGRMGRRWWAPAGSALLTSLLFRPTLPPAQPGDLPSAPAGADGLHLAQQLTMLCALAAADAITNLTTLSVNLKWPNDLIVGDHKLAGLLAESVFIGDRLDAVVVGLGINVNTDFTNAPSFMAPATSLRLELGHPIDRLPLLVAYLDGVARRYGQFKEGVSPYADWASRLVTLGQHVTAYPGDQTLPRGEPPAGDSPYLSGVAEGVDVDGALLVRTADGSVHRFLAADISLQKPDFS